MQPTLSLTSAPTVAAAAGVATPIAVPGSSAEPSDAANNGRPRARNKMGRRPSWSSEEVLAAVQALLEHPEGCARGAEAQAHWHNQLRSAFMARFRQLSAQNPALAAREDVWANRSARKIITEAKTAISSCRVLHVERQRGSDDEPNYPAVYNWLLQNTDELQRNMPEPELDADIEAETAAGMSSPPALGAVLVHAAQAPLHPRENGGTRRKRPRAEPPELERDERALGKYAVMEVETRRQHAELQALRDLFGAGSGASPAEVDDFLRLLRRNAMQRARVPVDLEQELASRDGAAVARCRARSAPRVAPNAGASSGGSGGAGSAPPPSG